MCRVFLIKAKYERLDHQMAKPEGSGGEHIGDAWVHLFIKTSVGWKELVHGVWANNAGQEIPVGKNLEDKKSD